MKKMMIAAVLASTLSTGAFAQMMPTSADGFRSAAMMSDSFEIESSRLALERSRNPRVRSFASMMVRDHSATTAALTGGNPGVAMSGPGAVGSTAAGAGIGLLVGGPIGAAVGAGVGATAGAATATSGRAAARQGMPVYVDQRKADMLNQLAAAQGRQFDALYVSMQVAAHEEAVALFANYAQNGRDPNLAAFAQQTLPALQHHHMMAQRLAR